jgi:hypothetical protein
MNYSSAYAIQYRGMYIVRPCLCRRRTLHSTVCTLDLLAGEAAWPSVRCRLMNTLSLSIPWNTGPISAAMETTYTRTRMRRHSHSPTCAATAVPDKWISCTLSRTKLHHTHYSPRYLFVVRTPPFFNISVWLCQSWHINKKSSLSNVIINILHPWISKWVIVNNGVSKRHTMLHCLM